MKLKIYNQFDELKLTVSPSDNSTRQRGVMADHMLALSFVSFDFVRLDVNDWVEFEGQRYWLIEEYVPKQTSTVEWEYDVKFYGPENLLSQALMLKTVDGENDPVFSLTAPAHEQVALVVENINRQMGTTDWKVGEVIDTENLVVDYEGTYCSDALNMIADAAETEWWIDGMTVNLGRCEYGESVPLGYANGAESIDIASADDVKFFTRLFPIGSSRNIDREHYGATRLQLPGGAKYVEQDTHLGIVEHYEREAFSGVYPRRIGTISSVRSESATGEDGDPFTIYYFKDEELSFDPNTYEIGGLVKQVTFQSGELNGREFEVNFNSKSREFEIITQWPYDDETQLPGGLLVPKPGDEYILWNLRMPDEYYTLAEKEFAEAVEAYMLKHRKDRRVYKVTTDYIDIGARDLRFDIGQRVRLESTRYFPENGYRDSRIVRFTQNLNIPTQYDLEISDVLSTGALSRIEDNIEEVRNYTRIATSNLPDVVRSWENTPASDFNLFSSKRSMKEFLNKRKADTARGLITFKEGMRIGDFKRGERGGAIDAEANAEFQTAVVRDLLRSTHFVDGMAGAGWQLWQDGHGTSNLTVDFLTVRQSLRIQELLLEKVRAVGGQLVVSASNGKIQSAELDAAGEYYLLRFETDCGVVAGDLIRCAVFNGPTPKAYWVEVAAVDNGVAAVAVSEFGGMEPAAGDEVVLMGNSENPLRQGVISISATEDGQPRIDVLNGVADKTFDGCLRARLGCLDGIKDDWFPADGQPEGYGLYADNAFLRGRFLLTSGEDVATKFEVMEGMIRSSIETFRDGSSILNNPDFADGIRYWETGNDIDLFAAGGRLLWLDGALLAKKGPCACVREEEGRAVMYIDNQYLKQRNADFKTRLDYETGADGLRKPRAFKLAFLYKCLEAGSLDVRFDGCDGTGFQSFEAFRTNRELRPDDEYRTFECSGMWNGTGDFRLSFTGKIFIYMLTLGVDEAEDLAYTYRTLFEQTDQLVRIATESFDEHGNLINTTGLVSRKDVTGLFAIGGDGSLQSFVGASTKGVFIKAGSIKLEGLVTANENFKILEDGSIEASNGVFKGEIEATKGSIGGFEIGRDHIGAAVDDAHTASFGNLFICRDFFRVGGNSGYAMLGNDVIPLSAGGAFSAVGRIVNKKPNNGAQWGFDSANYGLFIDVSGGTKNYGISSNAALMAPAFVGTKACLLTFSGKSYEIDFSQYNTILMYYNEPNYSGTTVTLPTELSVARQFGLNSLPNDFATTVTFRVRPGSKTITLKGIYNHNEDLANYQMAAGDSVTVLITKADGFRYQIVNHSN